MHKLARASALTACMLMAAIPVWASRDWHDAARGAKAAAVIVLGKVEEAWDVQPTYRFDGEERKDSHRLLRIRVLDVWKGDAKAGDEIFIVDQNALSTAAANVDERQPAVILYLTPVDALSGADPDPERHAWDRDGRWAEYRLSYNDPASILPSEGRWKAVWQLPVSGRPVPPMGDRALYHSLRESFPGDKEENWRATTPIEFENERKMLDAVFRTPPVADPMTRWREILDTSENADLLLYALEQFPKHDMPEADRARLVALMDRLPEGHRALYWLIKRFSYGEASIPATVFTRMLDRFDEKDRRSLILRVNGETLVGAWARVHPYLENDILANKPESQASAALRLLMRHDPAAARSLFEKRPEISPLLLLEYCIEAKTDADAFGRPPFSEAMLAVDRITLWMAQRYEIATDDTPGVQSLVDAPGQPNAEHWRALAPFFADHLSRPDSPARRRIVALLRTMGVTLTLKDGAYGIDPDGPGEPPLALTRKVLSEPVKAGAPVEVEWTLTATAPIFLPSGQPSVNWEQRREDGGGYGIGGGSNFLWFAFQDKQREPTEYEAWPAGRSVSVMHEFPPEWFRKPGRYDVKMSITFDRDGLEADVDAWTGLIGAEPAIITVE